MQETTGNPTSRLALAAIVALRSVLVYGEATTGCNQPLGWQDLMPRILRPAARGTHAAPAPELRTGAV